MTVNNYKFSINSKDKYLTFPINFTYDNLGKDDLIDSYEENVIEQVINPIQDFEVTRFSHNKWSASSVDYSDINYEFYFYDRSIDINNTTSDNVNNWVNDYNYVVNPIFSGDGFSDKEIYYSTNSYKNSFFKLDFYDTENTETQKLYFTIILPTQQGVTREGDIGTELVSRIVDVRTPKFKLDYVGDKEGYFIYWLKNPDKLNISPFYMTAKFFNGKNGQFVRMLNRPQALIPSKFNFKKSNYLYYKVFIDYDKYTYSVTNTTTNKRNGTNVPIKWYEYINP